MPSISKTGKIAKMNEVMDKAAVEDRIITAYRGCPWHQRIAVCLVSFRRYPRSVCRQPAALSASPWPWSAALGSRFIDGIS